MPHEAIVLLDRKRDEIMSAVPASARGLLEFGRLRLTVGSMIASNERLARCSPMSILTSVIEIVSRGLDLGADGQAFLVPYGSTCQPLIGSQGKIELAYRSGLVDRITVQVIYERDDVELDLAAGQVRHTVSKSLMLEIAKGGSRGEPLAAYALIWLKNSERPVLELMLFDDWSKIVENAKAKGRGRLSDAYRLWPGEMWRRSVLNRALKRIPKSRELSEALRRDLEVEFGETSAPRPKPSALPDDMEPTPAPDVIEATEPVPAEEG